MPRSCSAAARRGQWPASIHALSHVNPQEPHEDSRRGLVAPRSGIDGLLLVCGSVSLLLFVVACCLFVWCLSSDFPVCV